MSDVIIVDEECSFCGTDNVEVKRYPTPATGYEGHINLCYVCAYSPCNRMAEYPGNFDIDVRELAKMIAWATNHIITTLRGD